MKIETAFRGALALVPEQPFLLDAAARHSYVDIFQRCLHLATAMRQLEAVRLACYMADSVDLVCAMLAAGLSGKSLVMLNRDFTSGQIPELIGRYDIDTVISDVTLELPCLCFQLGELESPIAEELLQPAAHEGEILILTSGTTGQPKCARYSWADLFAQVGDRPAAAEERWLLAYRLNHFAGLQMLVHVLKNCGSLVLPSSSRVADAVSAMEHFGVTHVSSTPTFWRYALNTLPASAHGIELQHITLGSEAVSGALLEQLAERFPGVRIVHIYASTEAGSCVSVSDMRPGLPVDILQRGEGAAVQFRIVEGELHIRSRHGMRDYAGANEQAQRDEEGWLASGDLVRIEDDRILFMGRRSETINVGGVKVHPLEVENLVSAQEGVQLVRAYGQDNPVVGQIVALDLVCSPGFDEDAVEAGVRETCLALPRHARPRSINFVDTMETSNFKLKRQ